LAFCQASSPTSGRHIFSAHLRVGDGLGPGDQMRLLDQAEAMLEDEFGVYFSTLQFETEDRDEPGATAIDVGVRR
jgi:cobalt-zinc-cadmium efflux system protein